ncbi:MAG: hypothetical protein ACR2MP_10375 [Streptosporangiaceae bacterium]
MTKSRTEPPGRAAAGRFGQEPGRPAPNAGRKYPAEVLTKAEVAAILGR